MEDVIVEAGSEESSSPKNRDYATFNQKSKQIFHDNSIHSMSKSGFFSHNRAIV